MNLTRPRSLLIAGLGCLTGSIIVSRAVAAGWPQLLTIPWTSAVLTGLVALGLLVLAWPVRQFVRRPKRSVDRLRAASVLAFAKTCAIVGTALTGLYGGVLVVCWLERSSPAFQQRTWLAALASLTAAGLAVTGLVVERWCRLPPPGDDDAASA